MSSVSSQVVQTTARSLRLSLGQHGPAAFALEVSAVYQISLEADLGSNHLLADLESM